MGICKLCEKLREVLEEQLIGEVVLSAGRGSAQAHNRHTQAPVGDMKLASLNRLKGQAPERCTVAESILKKHFNSIKKLYFIPQGAVFLWSWWAPKIMNT